MAYSTSPKIIADHLFSFQWQIKGYIDHYSWLKFVAYHSVQQISSFLEVFFIT